MQKPTRQNGIDTFRALAADVRELIDALGATHDMLQSPMPMPMDRALLERGRLVLLKSAGQMLAGLPELARRVDDAAGFLASMTDDQWNSIEKDQT